MSLFSFTATGLIFALVGGVILLRAFAFTSHDALAAEAAPSTDRLRNTIRELCSRRIDIRFGAPLMLIGFYLQLMPLLGVSERPVAQFFFLAGLGVTLVYYGLMHGILAERESGHVLRLISSRTSLTAAAEKEKRPQSHSTPVYLHLVDAVRA